MPIWNSPEDWNFPDSQESVRHDDTPNTDNNDDRSVELGYSFEKIVEETNLELWLPMQEDSGSTANDLSGNERDGDIKGSMSINVSGGPAGVSGYSFDASDDYIDLPIGTEPDLTQSHTVCFWLEYSGSASWSPFISKRSSDGNTETMSTWIGSNSEFDYRTDTGSVIISDSSLTDGTLHFYCVVNDGGSVTVYQDGSQLGTGSAALSSSNTNAGMRVGGDYKGNRGSGNMFGLMIFGTPLTATGVGELYDIVSSGTVIPTEKTR